MRIVRLVVRIEEDVEDDLLRFRLRPRRRLVRLRLGLDRKGVV